MPAREDGVPVDTLREAVSRRVSSGSLRLIAAEIGLAHTTVASFLKGAQPYGRTLVKLRAWFGGETNELVRLRQENAELKKRIAELERQFREVKR